MRDFGKTFLACLLALLVTAAIFAASVKSVITLVKDGVQVAHDAKEACINCGSELRKDVKESGKIVWKTVSDFIDVEDQDLSLDEKIKETTD